MTYASTSIDRRAEYYARCAGFIAADPLDFYTRAEKGRKFLASKLNPYVEQAARPSPVRAVPLELVGWRYEARAERSNQLDVQKVLRAGAIAA